MPPAPARPEDIMDVDDEDFLDDDDDAVGRAHGLARRAPTRAEKGKGKASTSTSAAGRRQHAAAGPDGYSWEADYERTWDAVQEDATGSLEGAVYDFLQQAKRRRVLRDATAIQRGIIRHLYLVIDLSLSMIERDLRPTRLELSLQYAGEYVTEYFDQNPISQMAIIGMKDGVANRITALSGNSVEHQAALRGKDERTKMKLEPSGEPSLQNALEMARNGLSHLPTHGSREVLIIFGSLTTCDPHNIHTTIDALVKDKVRVNIIGLSAEMAVCREICKRTGGTYGVVINEAHFKDLLFATVPPPAVRAERQANGTAGRPAADLMAMGFPTRPVAQHPTLCACHTLPRVGGFVCPRCRSKVCDVPTDCTICGLTVVSSPHLARSYRHLFPVKDYLEVNGPSPEGDDLAPTCFGCGLLFEDLGPGNTTAPVAGTAARGGETGRYACPKCHRHFCLGCDLLVHESLAVCPGCAE